jgi:flagellar motor switch protein FliM
MKFSSYFSSLRHPRPIYFIALEPFHGTGLFVVDNRFAAFCLKRAGSLSDDGTTPRLTPQNQARVQGVVQRMLADFDHSWAGIHPVRTRLKKVTTYPFRARILNPYDPCLVAQIHLSGRNISSRLTWCFPRAMLEPVLPRLRESRVIPPLGMEGRPEGGIPPERLLEGFHYGLQVRVGQVEVPIVPGALKVGQVVSLEGEAAKAVVEVEGRPVLVGSVGEAGGHYAVRVDGAYDPPRKGPLVDPAAFRPLQWPSALPE